MKTFLSIDWDYFVDATSDERMLLFPDSGNERLAASIQVMTWAFRYSDGLHVFEKKLGRKIEDIGIIQKEYTFIKNYLKKLSQNLTSLCISESHSLAYQMFSEQLEVGEKCNIINIDYHHDLYVNTQGCVDCGNWLSELNREGMLNQLYWVARNDSDDVPKVYKDSGNITKTTDLFELLKRFKAVDGVFLCRSGAWSPPHLDNKFTQLIQSFYKHYNETDTNLLDRYTPEFRYAVSTHYEQSKQFYPSIS